MTRVGIDFIYYWSTWHYWVVKNVMLNLKVVKYKVSWKKLIMTDWLIKCKLMTLKNNFTITLPGSKEEVFRKEICWVTNKSGKWKM